MGYSQLLRALSAVSALCCSPALAQTPASGWGSLRIGMSVQEVQAADSALSFSVGEGGWGFAIREDAVVIDGQPFSIQIDFGDGGANQITLEARYQRHSPEMCAARFPAVLSAATQELGPLTDVAGNAGFLRRAHMPDAPPVIYADPIVATTPEGLAYFRYEVPEYALLVLLSRAPGARRQVLLSSGSAPGDDAPSCEARIEIRR